MADGKPVIVSTSPGFGKHGRVPELIAERGWEFITCTDTSKPDGGVSEHIGRADALVVGLVPVTPETLEQGGTKVFFGRGYPRTRTGAATEL